MLKANKLSENGNDNFKRKEMILKVLQTEDLLTMINNMRPPPTCSEENPTGYSPQRMIHDELGKHAVSADDQFLYAHDYARLYGVVSIATSESLQFLFPEATTSGNGIMLWESIISKLFGMTYRDAFDAAEKLWKWYIDPNKPLPHDIHILMLLVKRANETAKTVLPEASILGMLLLSFQFFLPPDCCLWGASLESEGISGVFLLGTGIKLFGPVSFTSRE